MDTKSIEEKAKEYLKSIGIEGKYQTEGALFRTNDFTAGYRARDEEVVNVIDKVEAYMDYYKSLAPMYNLMVDVLTEIKNELTHLNLNS